MRPYYFELTRVSMNQFSRFIDWLEIAGLDYGIFLLICSFCFYTQVN